MYMNVRICCHAMLAIIGLHTPLCVYVNAYALRRAPPSIANYVLHKEGVMPKASQRSPAPNSE